MTHLAPLTWLRAFAAFLVVVSHALRGAEVSYYPGDGEPTLLLVRLFDLGDFGVCLFFVLSGCTLTLSTQHRLKGMRAFCSFYLRRWMRIWPAFAVSLAVYLLFITLFQHDHLDDQRPWVVGFVNPYSLEDVLRYLSLTYNITGPRNLFNMAYWTLPVEFQYYLLLPFALILMRGPFTNRLIPILFGATLVGIHQWLNLSINRDEVFALGWTFFGGVLLAASWDQTKRALNAHGGTLLIIIVVGFLAFDEADFFPRGIHHLGLSPFSHYGLTALVMVAIALHFEAPPLPQVLKNVLEMYGEVSYSIYLYHVLCINVAILLLNQGQWRSPNEKLLFILITALISSLVIGKIGYRLIEQPAIRLGRRWSRD
jgi:peptidoglycan/LPS O-acetylase OafA/YrhL